MSLKIVNLSKRLKDRWVLRDISFEVKRGEILGLFGPSGSGKTVLIETILGISQPTSGAIFFDDKNVTKLDRDTRDFHIPHATDGSIWKRLLKNERAVSKGEQLVGNLNNALDGAQNVLLLDDSVCGIG